MSETSPSFSANLIDPYLEELRDQFAMAALTRILSQQTIPSDCNEIAEFCYKISDAMLEARKKQTTS